MVQIVYFARIREALGVDGEVVSVQTGMDILALLDQLTENSDRHAAAFADRSKLRFAIDQKMARSDAVLDGATELAIFPPVTGG